jgi:hypothetical protein
VTDHAPDDELLARLRAADPASSLPTADPARVAELLEAAMSETTTRPTESRDSGTHGRSPLTWLVAAAAVVLIAAAGVFGLAQRGHDPAPTAAPTVTQLSYSPPTTRCMLPNVAVLQDQSVAFQGTLTSLQGGVATFDITHWYAGGPTDTAEVAAPSSQLGDLVQAADLQVGHTYLVAAHDGTVTSCGFTGPARRHLLDLYGQAFGG